jgi:hypothetical protein
MESHTHRPFRGPRHNYGFSKQSHTETARTAQKFALVLADPEEGKPVHAMEARVIKNNGEVKGSYNFVGWHLRRALMLALLYSAS